MEAHTGKPQFIVGGAPRSGTTWLYHALDRHPGVYMAKPVQPEPKFFLVDELYARGLSYYVETWFSEANAGRCAGEKSTNYLESETAAGRIARDLPHVKLIFLLRDPAERAYSNWLWSRQNGFETEDFATAIRLEEARARTLAPRYRYTRPYSYFSRGLYAALLRPYCESFPREQLLILRFEDIATRPRELIAQVHRFLAVTPRPEDAHDLGPKNESRKDVSDMPDEVKMQLRARYAESNAALGKMLGAGFAGWD